MKTIDGSEDRPATSEDGLTIIYSPDDVPEFADENEEVAYWESHTWSDALYEAAKQPRNPLLPPPREAGKPPLLRPTSLRLDRYTTDRLRTLAKRKGVGYQTLLKQFLLERYEEEKREGIL